MTDRPILFSAPMVRALLDGRKTQTRRIFKGIEAFGEEFHVFNAHGGVLGVREEDVPSAALDYAPYAPGDRLWVREQWGTFSDLSHIRPAELPRDARIFYQPAASYPRHDPFQSRIRPGIHMPRWASRLTLIVTDVRVQRLQEISSSDLAAEGMFSHDFLTTKGDWLERGFKSIEQCRFHDLWNSLNATRGFGWDANPWVVAVSFRVIPQNIDQIDKEAA